VNDYKSPLLEQVCNLLLKAFYDALLKNTIFKKNGISALLK